MAVELRRLVPADAEAFRQLRLRGLRGLREHRRRPERAGFRGGLEPHAISVDGRALSEIHMALLLTETP
jgi:hypothetical protein